MHAQHDNKSNCKKKRKKEIEQQKHAQEFQNQPAKKTRALMPQEHNTTNHNTTANVISTKAETAATAMAKSIT